MAGKIIKTALIILTLVLAALFIICALDIYRQGLEARALRADAEIYTSGAIASHFRIIQPVLVLWLVLLLVSIVYKPGREEEKAQNRAPNEGIAVRGPLWLTLALIALAVVLIVLGIMNGGLRDVLVKAVNICSECIGLG